MIKKYAFIILSGVLLLTLNQTVRAAGEETQKKNEKLLKVIRDIGERFQVHFTYDRAVVEGVQIENYTPDGYSSVNDALEKVLKGTRLKYIVLEDQYVVIYRADEAGLESLRNLVDALRKVIDQKPKGASGRVTASLEPLLFPELAALTVSGKVTDHLGEPLAGVSVVVKGTNQGTATDLDGNYTLESVDENATLVFTYTGFKTKEIAVNSQSSISVTLEEDVQALDEVVVTAMGIRRETKALGYSVTKLDGDEIVKNRSTNFANSLSARVAGVNVSGVGTGPAGASRITIRGNTSISGDNQPLYVINGIPMDNTQFGAPQGEQPDWGDNISSINPDDIEDITVLKGATAAALYGSRAKNGAILITTKSGKGQQGVGIEVNSNVTFDVPHYIWDLQTEYGQGYGGFRPASREDAANHGQNHWGEPYDGKPTIQFDGVERPYSYVKESVLDDFYQVGHTASNNISFSKGSENGSFRVGLTNMMNQGIVPNANMKRNNISLGLNQTIAEKLTISANVDYIDEAVNNRYVTTGGRGGLAATILYVNSNMPTSALAPGYDENFQEKTLGTDLNATNPYFVLNRMGNRTDKDRFISSVSARWDLMEGLFIQGRAGQDYYSFASTNIIPDGTGFRKPGEIDQRDMNFWERNFEALIGLDRDLNEDLALTVNLGGNLMSQRRNTTSITGSGFVIPQLHVVNNTSLRDTRTDIYEKKINSIFATAELGFKDYLYLNLTGRNDWFSTLNPKSNSFFYPSAGISFVFSDAFRMPSAISFGKLRVAYASVGGDTDPYLLNLTYGLLGYSYDGRSLGNINQVNVPNDELRPLSVDEFEVGLDLRLFNNRLGFDIAAYNKLTTNDIAVETISTTSGYSGVSVNVGEIRNRGIEFLVTGTPVTGRNFNWDISANLAYNKSKVLKISDASNELVLATSTKAFIKHIEGMEYSQIVGRTILRNEQGQDIIDETGLPIVPVDVKPFGSGIHRYTTGLMNTFSYKAFSLSFLIDAKFGAKVYSETNYSLEHRGMSPGSLLGRKDGAVLPGVTESGEPNQVRVSADRVNNRAIIVRRRDALDDYLYDAGFIKLRNFALTYNMPASVYNKIGFLKGASLSLIGNNVAILMKHTPGIDPETNFAAGNAQGIENSQLPPIRTFGFNLNLKF